MKRLALTLALVLSLSALSGCGSSQTSSQAGSSTGEAASATSSSSEEKSGDSEIALNVMHFHTPETMSNSIESEAYNKLADEFMAANSDVKWNVTTLQQSDFHTKIMALAAANEMPDIYFAKGSWIQNFYDSNLMADLTDSIDATVYRDGIFTPFTRDNRIYSLPIQFVITSVVYYNQPMWQEIGYEEFPKTWEELEAANEKFSANGITTIALGNKDKWPYESCIISTLGDRFTGTDWTQSIITGDGTAKFTDPEFVSTLETSQQFAKMFNIDFNAITNEQADNLYGTGKAAATVEGGWTVSYLTANADQEVIDNTRLALLPDVPGQKGASGTTSGGAGWGQSISAKLEGEALKIAIEYNKATTGVENCEYMMEKQGYIGQCQVDAQPTEELNSLQKAYMEFSNSLTLVPIYDIQMDGAVIDVMNSKLQELLSGTITPQAAAEAIQAEQDKLSA